MDWNRKVGTFCLLVSAGMCFILIGRMFPESLEAVSDSAVQFAVDWIGGHIAYPLLDAEIGQLCPVVDASNRNLPETDWKEAWADTFFGRLYPAAGMADEHEPGGLEDWGKIELSLREWGLNGAETENQGDSQGESDVSDKTDSQSENPTTVSAEQEEPGEEAAVTPENPSSSETLLTLPALTGHLYTVEELSDISVIKSLYVIDSSAKVYDTDFDAQVLLNKDLTMKQDNSKPQILIYHSHSQEGYADSVEGDMSTGVVGIGDYLKELLEEQYGYQVIHHKGVYDMTDGQLDRSMAYERAYVELVQILEEYPSLEVLLDIHRDGVSEDTRLVTEVNGKPTAKLMFFNGLSRVSGVEETEYEENPYLADNMAMSLQMKCLGMAYFPDLTRPNFIRGYNYNMDLRPKSMLIEVGAQTNTYEEAKNAMEPLAILLHEILQ